VKKRLAIAWLLAVLVFCLILGWKIASGISLQTDLMALLPHGSSDKAEYQVSNEIISTLSKRVVLLVGDADQQAAICSAGKLLDALKEADLLRRLSAGFDEDSLRDFGTRYFPYRSGLLSPEDRRLLEDGQGERIKNRALTTIFSPLGFAQARLIEHDPFLLFPSFLTSLSARSTASVKDGFLCFSAEGRTWVLLSGSLNGSPYDFSVQERLNAVVANVHSAEVLRLGTVFYAREGAKEAMTEMTVIGICSLAGIVLLLFFVFRSIFPIYFGLLVIGIGMVTGFTSCLLIWGTIHSTSLLFGLSLIGITIDYCLEYCSKVFSPGPGGERINKVFWGILIGTGTTLLGYFALFITPFPGLRQIAVFSLVGVSASCVTVLLWAPFLDRMPVREMRPSLRLLSSFLGLSSRWFSYAVGAVIVVVCGFGLAHFKVDDDIRNLQNLSATLKHEQERIAEIIHLDIDNRFVLVHAASREQGLQIEETVADRLEKVIDDGGLQSFQFLARFIPSARRQRDNRRLAAERLYAPYLTAYQAALHMSRPIKVSSDVEPLLDFKTGLQTTDALGLTSLLLPGGFPDYQVMLLSGIKDIQAVRTALEGVPGATLISPTDTYSELFGKYRNRALLLLGVSILFIAPITIFRYGRRRGFVVMAAPFLAIVLTPLWVTGAGLSITFFDAIALVLVFSMGVDYMVFLEEAGLEEHTVTSLAVTLSAITTCLSFGVLAFSQVQAVAHFGLSMFIGISLSLFFAAVFSRRGGLAVPACLLLGGLVLIGGCAPKQLGGTAAPTHKVALARGLELTFPPAFEYPQSYQLLQNVVADYKGEKYSFVSRIALSSERALIVCMNHTGQRLLTIDWQGRDISYEKAMGADQLRPANVLADIFMMYWSLDVVNEALAPSAHMTESDHRRVVLFRGEPLVEITYSPDGTPGPGSDRVVFHNLHWGYSLTINSEVF